MSLLLIQSPWVTPSWVSNSYLEVPLNTSSETEENPSRGPPFRQYKFFQSVLFHIFSLQKGWSSGVYSSAIPTACLTGPGVQIVFVFSFKYFSRFFISIFFFLLVWYNWTNGIVPKPHPSGTPGSNAQNIWRKNNTIWTQVWCSRSLYITSPSRTIF